jgi:hypothetical protein
MTQATASPTSAPAAGPTPAIDNLLIELRRVWDEEDGLNDRLNALGKRKAAIKALLLDYHTSSGLASFANELIGASFKADLRARVDPEKWADLHKWAVDTGNTHIFHRRLTDTKVKELLNEGVALPEGLTLESYTAINLWRKRPCGAAA